MAYTIRRALGHFARTGDTDGPILGFEIDSGEVVTTVVATFTHTALVTLGRLGDGGWDAHELQRVLERHTLRRIELHLLSGGAQEELGTQLWALTSYEIDELKALREKDCEYQLRLARSLYCSIPSEIDETARVVPNVPIPVAPTSRPTCRGCQLPDTDAICSHVMHPTVSAYLDFGPDHVRQPGRAMCDRGSPNINEVKNCRPGGHECWERVVEVDQFSQPSPALLPLTLPEAFDFLDAVWRLAFNKRPLVVPPTVADAAGIAVPVATKEEFEARISDLADLIDNLHPHDDDLPDTLDKEKRKGRLNCVEAALNAKVADEDARDRVSGAVQMLRTIRQIRHGYGHSGASKGLPAAYAAVGVTFPPTDWPGTWDRVRTATTIALTTLRDEVRRLIT